MELFAKYHPTNSFQPLHSEDFRKSLRLKEGDFLKIENWNERSVGFHKRFFAMLNCSINHFPEDDKYDRFRNINYLRKELLIYIGECEVTTNLMGQEHTSAKSISFRNMDQEKFEKIYSLTLDVLLKHFLNHLSMEDFVNDIQNFF
jgi:hypothetical protein